MLFTVLPLKSLGFSTCEGVQAEECKTAIMEGEASHIPWPAGGTSEEKTVEESSSDKVPSVEVGSTPEVAALAETRGATPEIEKV